MLTNVSIQFGYELIYNLIENKAGYYTETIVAAAEDKPEPSTNIVLADEVKTATSEVIVAAKVENKADAVAEAEAKVELLLMKCRG